MESGIIPAIISLFLPGVGQALTDGKPTNKWLIAFVIICIVEFVLLFFGIGLFINWIINVVFAYDAFANKIDIDSIF